MKIGIIGAGTIGYHLAKKLSVKNNVFLAASKYSEVLEQKASETGATAVQVQDAVSGMDVVIISIPLKAIPELPKNLFEHVPDTLVIAETCNYYSFRDGLIKEIEDGKVQSIWVAEQLGRPVIKAFNNVLAPTILDKTTPKGAPGRIALSVAGDDQKAKDVISSLIEEVGFDVVDGGKLADSWRQQPGTPAYCTELNSSQIVHALEIADRKKAVDNQNVLIGYLKEHNWSLPHEQLITLGRSINGVPN